MDTAVEISGVFAKEKCVHLSVPRFHTAQVRDRLCPIFQLSNVTGEGLDYVRALSLVLRLTLTCATATDILESVTF